MVAKDRATGKVAVRVIEKPDKPTLIGFVADHTVDESTLVFTDEHAGYKGMVNHVAVPHSRGEYVHGEVHTNGAESHFSMFKRGIVGTYHHISPKHTGRYATEFAGRHNNRPLDTEEQMNAMAKGIEGRRLPYALSSPSRSCKRRSPGSSERRGVKGLQPPRTGLPTSCSPRHHVQQRLRPVPLTASLDLRLLPIEGLDETHRRAFNPHLAALASVDVFASATGRIVGDPDVLDLVPLADRVRKRVSLRSHSTSFLFACSAENRKDGIDHPSAGPSELDPQRRPTIRSSSGVTALCGSPVQAGFLHRKCLRSIRFRPEAFDKAPLKLVSWVFFSSHDPPVEIVEPQCLAWQGRPLELYSVTGIIVSDAGGVKGSRPTYRAIAF